MAAKDWLTISNEYTYIYVYVYTTRIIIEDGCKFTVFEEIQEFGQIQTQERETQERFQIPQNPDSLATRKKQHYKISTKARAATSSLATF